MPTCREKLLDEHPELIGDIDPHNCQICPNEYGYAPKPEYCDDQTMTDEEACKMCWDREAVVPTYNKTKYNKTARTAGSYLIDGFAAGISENDYELESKAKAMAEATVQAARLVPVRTIEEIAETDTRKILDSGTRREFETGAVRDIQEGKGRCDLLPLDVMSEMYSRLFKESARATVFEDIDTFMKTGAVDFLYDVLSFVPSHMFGSDEDMLLEVAKHFEEGAKKYGEDNWQKGIPVHCYIDSAVRHYLKFLRGDMDEPHDRAFVWNIMCAIWTCKNKPELNEYLKDGVGDV